MVKLTPVGDLIWAAQFGGSGADVAGKGIAIDASGAVYTTGSLYGTANFDPGTGTHNLSSPTPLASSAYVSKLDAQGHFVWADGFGVGINASGSAVAVDGAGAVVAAGFFNGTGDFDPGAGTHDLTSVGGNNAFVTKLDAFGNFVWADQFGAGAAANATGIALEGAEAIYTSGSFSGTGNFDPGAGTYNLVSAGGNNAFVAKLDTSGNLVWADRLGAGADTSANAIVMAAGALYTAGSFTGTGNFDPGAGTHDLASATDNAGGSNAFVARLDPSGSLVWADRLGAGSSKTAAYRLALDGAGNVYVSGSFAGTGNFDPGAGTQSLICSGARNAFVSQFDPAGAFVSVFPLGAGYDIGATATCIAVNSEGAIATAGGFNGAGDFNPGPAADYLGSPVSYYGYFGSGFVVSLPLAFLYDANARSLTVTGESLESTQATTGDAAGLHTTYTFTIDGKAQSFPDTALSQVVVNGARHTPYYGDTGTLVANDTYLGMDGRTHETPERALLGTGGGVFQKSDSNNVPYTFLTFNGFGVTYAYLGPADSGELFDTPGDDIFVTAGSYSYVTGSGVGYGVYRLISGAASVYDYTINGGHDQVWHYDAPGSLDAFVASGNAFSYTSGTAADGHAFFNVAVAFPITYGISLYGNAIAYLLDSPGNDVFLGSSSYSYMSGPNYFNVAVGIALVYGESFVGGTDYAYNYDPYHNILAGFHLLT